jgi:non-ribosomal peptide synthetase component E (peptide arylation enzyme)
METLPALWAKMQFFADVVAPRPDDVHLMYLPICHAFGLKLTLMALASGGRLVLADRFSPAHALRLIGDERVTILPATPTHLTLLLRELDANRHSVASLRWVVSAAAPLPPSSIDGVYEQLDAELLYVYGCSEGFLTQTADRDEIRAGSVGTQVFAAADPAIAPDGSVAILDPVNEAPLDADEVGEIAFGATRAVRYFGQPARADGGWYRSGDLGRLDAQGRLFVSGRLKEVVNRGGMKVACGEVEAALAAHPAFAECAVIGTPDEVLGEAICACVVARDAGVPTIGHVRVQLAERLARHKLPDELCVVEALPRTSVGKLDRAALAALVIDGDLPRARLRPAVVPTVAGD